MEEKANISGLSESLQAFDHLLQAIFSSLGALCAWIFLIGFPILAFTAFVCWVKKRDEGWKEALRGKEQDIQRLADDNRILRSGLNSWGDGS
jgi:hypothetical protein